MKTRDWDRSIAEYYFELTPIRIVVLPVIVSDTAICDEIVFLKDSVSKQLYLPNTYITDQMLCNEGLISFSQGSGEMAAIYHAIIEAIETLPFIITENYINVQTDWDSYEDIQRCTMGVCQQMASRLHCNVIGDIRDWNYAFQYTDVSGEIGEAAIYVRVPITHKKEPFNLASTNIVLRAGDGEYEINKIKPLETRNLISRNHFKLLKTLR